MGFLWADGHADDAKGFCRPAFEIDACLYHDWSELCSATTLKPAENPGTTSFRPAVAAKRAITFLDVASES